MFTPGPFPVDIITDKSSALNLPEKKLLVITPKTGGSFPLVLFQHGFICRVDFYKQMMCHVASYGFIVVAPQMYGFTLNQDASSEINTAIQILNWLSESLQSILDKDRTQNRNKNPNEEDRNEDKNEEEGGTNKLDNINNDNNNPTTPDFSKVAIMGHSRGGKVAFGITLGTSSVKLTKKIKISALVTIDPLDGGGENSHSPPVLLTGKKGSFNFSHPTLVIGSGLGGSCNPETVGHKEFFFECSKNSYHFIVCDFGHTDIFDDRVGLRGEIFSYLCKNGPNRKDMRDYVGGLVAAFLKSAMLKEDEKFREFFERYEEAPVRVICNKC